MPKKDFFSIRTGTNPNTHGFSLSDLNELFCRLYGQLAASGYFDEAFGFFCVDADHIPGKVADVEFDILMKLRKKQVWPIVQYHVDYSEDDLFDMIEYLHEHVSKPIDGSHHSFGNCGMHWETFSKSEGQMEFREKVNELLDLYREPFVINTHGDILRKPEKGFERIFEADVPSDDKNVYLRVDAAVLKFRKHGASLDDRRQAVRDLADVLEYLRPHMKSLLNNKDEADLFNIANNFGIRHHNEQQKTNYDSAIWLSWMFYFYLSTIHVVLRKMEQEKGINRVEPTT
ncbi:MAG: hypothetical protein Q7W05_03365 [Deltaproteobacteria bacterium]|nr:hypothetical protein [Deltaproteobacteria bacterium]